MLSLSLNLRRGELLTSLYTRRRGETLPTSVHTTVETTHGISKASGRRRVGGRDDGEKASAQLMRAPFRPDADSRRRDAAGKTSMRRRRHFGIDVRESDVSGSYAHGRKSWGRGTGPRNFEWGPLMQIVTQILSRFKIASTNLLALQCEARTRT